MKVIKRDLGEQYKEIKLIALSDLHVGDQLCNLKKIREVLQTIKESNNTFVILNGDLMNNATTQSVSDTYSEQMTPTEQILKLCELLEPIKDRILVIHPGNHENRTMKTDGVDIIRLVAKQLGIEDRFSAGWWYLYLTLGMGVKQRPIMYEITGYHGAGGGRKIGGKANMLIDMSNKVVADVYVCGHTHQSIVTKDSIFIPDQQHKTLVKKEKFYLNTTSFLDYGGYAEQFGYTPGTIDNNIIELSGTKKKIKMILE